MKPTHGAPKRLLADDAPDLPEVKALLVSADLTSLVPDEGVRDRAWRRFRAGAIEAPSFARWRLRSLALASAMALAVVVVALQRDRGTRVVAVDGETRVSSARQGWVPAKPGAALRAGDQLQTLSGSLSLQAPEISEIALRPQTDLLLESLGKTTVLALQSGELSTRITHHDTGASYEIRAGRYTIRDVGTIFSVRRHASEILVRVQEGLVEVLGDPQTHWVHAGETWSSEEPKPTPLAGSPAADRPAPAPLAANPPPQAAAPASTPREGTGPARRIDDRARASRRGACPGCLVPATAEAPSAPSGLPVAPAAPVEPYLAALDLDAAGHHLEAAQSLERIARAGAHADLAIYELGRIRQRELKDPTGALDAFLQYRQRYPAGSLGHEVSISIIELNLDLARFDAALGEMNGFLQRYPGSERAQEIHLLRGNVLRDRGLCLEALADYGAVKTDALEGDALYGAASCEQRLGRREGAVALWKEYLQRFPEGTHQADVKKALGPQ